MLRRAVRVPGKNKAWLRRRLHAAIVHEYLDGESVHASFRTFRTHLTQWDAAFGSDDSDAAGFEG